MPSMTRNDSSMVGDSKWGIQGSQVGPLSLTGKPGGSLTSTQRPVALGNGWLVAPMEVGWLVAPDSLAGSTTNGGHVAGGTCEEMEAEVACSTPGNSSMACDPKSEVAFCTLGGTNGGALTSTQLPVALGNGAGQPGCGGMLVSPDSIMAVPTTTETEISSMVCDSKWPVATEGERFAGGTCNGMEALCDPRK